MQNELNSWEQLLGHDEQRQLFQRSLQQGRLSHAYVLAGPAGIGKLTFARLLAMSVFCRNHELAELQVCGECRACRSFLANSWPDYIEIGVPPGKTSLPIALIAGEGDKRGREGLCYELSMAPQSSDRRVAVIDDAGLMQAESANALLKTLEEPPADSLILLICDNPDTLLPTIRSRCQVVRFFPLAETDVAQILLAQEFVETPQDAQAVAVMAEGSLETARQLLQPELRQLKSVIARQVGQLDAMQPLQISTKVIEAIEQISANPSEQRQNAQWLLRFIADSLRDRMHSLAKGDLADPLTKRLGARNGMDLLDELLGRIIKSSAHIDGLTPMKLSVEALFDDLARMCRDAMKRQTSVAP